MAEEVVFARLEATIATDKLGAVRLSHCKMRLEVLLYGEGLVRRTDAAMIWPGASCVHVLDVIYELVHMVEAGQTMTTFVRSRKRRASRARKCRRAQRRLSRQARHRRRTDSRVGGVANLSHALKLLVARRRRYVVEIGVKVQK